MTTRRVFIHIGSDKAGSTAIQSALNRNRTWLAERGVWVPTTGLRKAAGHADLFSKFDDSTVEALRTEILGEPDHATALLSWEGIGSYDELERNRFRAVIESVFPNAELSLVYYVRNQVDLIQSGVLQQVKQLTLPPSMIRRLNQPYRRIGTFERRRLFPRSRRFASAIDSWEGLLPDAEIVVGLYDRDRLRNGDIVDDFLYTIGLEADEAFQRPRADANPSLTADAALFVEERFGDSPKTELQRSIDAVLSYPGGSTCYLFDDTRAEIRRYYAQDNAELIGRFPQLEGIDDARSPAGSSIGQAEVALVGTFFEELASFPTLMAGMTSAHELPEQVLFSGWSERHEHGHRTLGPESIIRFRPRSQHFTGYSDRVAIRLRGRYIDPERNSVSHVVVNDRVVGSIDLTSTPFVVDMDQMDSMRRIEVRLEHHGTSASDASAFELRRLRYSVLDSIA